MTKLGVFGLERFLPLLFYAFFLHIDDINSIKILASVQLAAALTELGIRNSLGVETKNFATIIRLHSVVSILVLMYLIVFAGFDYFYLFCSIQIMIAAGAAYKLKCLNELEFFGMSVMLFICLIGIMNSPFFIILLTLVYLFLISKLIKLAMGAESLLGFLAKIEISKYAILSLPMTIVVPLDLFVSSIVINDFIPYHNTIRMLVVVSLPFIIFNYFNSVNIQNYTYGGFLGEKKLTYFMLLLASFVIMYSVKNLEIVQVDYKLAVSFVVLMVFGPIYQFILRAHKMVALSYLIVFYIINFLPYFFTDILGAKLAMNVCFFLYLCISVVILLRYESEFLRENSGIS